VNREQAWEILTEYVQSESLRKHCLAVEAAMRAYARKYGEDEEKWSVVGLLHDFDFEIHPTADKHPAAGAPLLRDRGVPEDIIYAIQTHAEYLNLPRDTRLEKTLYAVDELAGFLVAVALVRPGRTLEGIAASSIKKKMKDKAFARAVRREDIVQGAQELGEPFDEHLVFVAQALQASPELGLGAAEPTSA
jgi:putative nucleotidyltransferase with HDIG domain